MMTIQKELVSFLIEKGIVVTPEVFHFFAKKNPEELALFAAALQGKSQEEIQALLIETRKEAMLPPSELPQPREELQKAELQDAAKAIGQGTISLLLNYDKKEGGKAVQDFVSYFNARYKALEKILQNRTELQGITAIKRMAQKEEKEKISVIGIVKNVQETKNNNIILELEDVTGEGKIIIQKAKKELFTAAKTITPDEVIGVLGTTGKGVLFAERIIWPDIPVTHELKKAPNEELALFLSDIHVGSKQFLAKSFEKFLKWIRGELGDEKQRELTKKVKYIFIIGDVVDGVGIYPGQENDLEIMDIYEQYKACTDLLKQIPEHISLIICPGNHDAMRLSEPQLPLPEDIAKPFWEMKNVFLVSNPAWVTVGQAAGFPGITVLLYHGYSFDYYIANIDEIRNNGGYDRADLVMKFLLQRRHLAPTHASCLYIPYPDHDPLFISKIPDIFATGHLHKTSVSQYRNVTLICGSCWQGKTAFQEKMGHNPEPGRVPMVNLQTREVKILRFGD